MSHFTKVETQLKDLGTICKALQRMELTWRMAENGQKIAIKGLEKQMAEADLEIKTGCSYSVGVQLGETCKLVADWWAIETYTGKTQQEFIDGLTKEYAYVTVMDRVSQMGYSVVSEEENAGQEIRVVVRKWN